MLFSILLLAVLAAGVTVWAYWSYWGDKPITTEFGAWGQFGDFFGGILNPVFGFLSVLGLLWALSLQMREISSARDDAQSSREAQLESNKALALQNEAIRKQSFEQTFFAMLRLLEEVVQSCTRVVSPLFLNATMFAGESTTRPVVVTGRRAIAGTVRSVGLLNTEAVFASTTYETDVLALLDEIPKEDPEGYLFRYARTLLTTLDYLKAHDVAPGSIYAMTLRSQLSSSEVLLIYFLCFEVKRWRRLKELVEHYGLLAFLNQKETGAGTGCVHYFDAAAFRE